MPPMTAPAISPPARPAPKPLKPPASAGTGAAIAVAPTVAAVAKANTTFRIAYPPCYDEEAFRFWDDMLCEVQRDYERRCASVDRTSRSDRNLSPRRNNGSYKRKTF